MGSNDKRLVIFTHIQKTAGTTLGRLLKNKYGFWPLSNLLDLELSLGLHYYHKNYHTAFPLERLRKLNELSEAQKRKVALIQGHMSYGVHTYFPQQYQYVTALRDPIERVLSAYNQIYNKGHAPIAEEIRKIPIEQFVRERRLNAFSNYQAKLLAGLYEGMPGNFSPYGYVDASRDSLERAKDHLRNYYVFALTERFDESVVMMGNILGWRNCLYIKSNVSKGRKQKAEVAEAVIDAIRDANELDMELYQYARTRFDELVAEQGPGFQQQVTNFQRANTHFNRLFYTPLDLSYKLAKRHHKKFPPRH